MYIPMIIRTDLDAWNELRSAIEVLQLLVEAGETPARRIEYLDHGVNHILNAIPKENYDKMLQREAQPWAAMTDDDWLRASNWMRQHARSEVEKGHGGFMTAWLNVIYYLGDAHNRADMSNQKMVRSMCGQVFWWAHNMRLAEKKQRNKQD